MSTALSSSVATVTTKVLAATAAGPAGPALGADVSQEALAAAALCDVLLQLFPTQVHNMHAAASSSGSGTPGGVAAAAGAAGGAGMGQLLGEALRGMASMLAHPRLPATGLNVKVRGGPPLN